MTQETLNKANNISRRLMDLEWAKSELLSQVNKYAWRYVSSALREEIKTRIQDDIEAQIKIAEKELDTL